MLGIDQQIFNQIAKTQEVEYQLMKVLFAMNEEESESILEDMVCNIYDRILRSTKNPNYEESKYVAKGIISILPYYLENKAISRYIKEACNEDTHSEGYVKLREQLPYITSPLMGARIISDEFNIDSKYFWIVRDILRHLKRTMKKTKV